MDEIINVSSHNVEGVMLGGCRYHGINQSTKSGLEPTAGVGSSVSATRTRWPLVKRLSKLAMTPALSSPM
jgi:hypothetical protein